MGMFEILNRTNDAIQSIIWWLRNELHKMLDQIPDRKLHSVMEFMELCIGNGKTLEERCTKYASDTTDPKIGAAVACIIISIVVSFFVYGP